MMTQNKDQDGYFSDTRNIVLQNENSDKQSQQDDKNSEQFMQIHSPNLNGNSSLNDIQSQITDGTQNNNEEIEQKALDLAFASSKNIFLKEKPYACTFLTIILLVSLINIIIFYDKQKYNTLIEYWGFTLFFVPVYIIYLIEPFFSPVPRYLMNIKDQQQFLQYQEKIKKTDPTIKFKAKAFHYKQMNKKVTFVQKSKFDFKFSDDRSADLTELFEHLPIFRLHTQVAWEFGNDQAEFNFNKQKEDIIKDAKKLDCHVDDESKACVKGLKQRILAFSIKGDKPFMIHFGFFLVFTFIGLSLPYRMYFNAVTGYLDYTVHKVINC